MSHLSDKIEIFRIKSDVCDLIRQMKRAQMTNQAIVMLYKLKKLIIRYWFRQTFRLPNETRDHSSARLYSRKNLRQMINECLSIFSIGSISSRDIEYQWFLRKILQIDQKTKKSGGSVCLVEIRTQRAIVQIAKQVTNKF